MGLSIVRTILEATADRSASNGTGGGAIFEITLPSIRAARFRSVRVGATG